MQYQIRECLNPACGLRYPLPQTAAFGERCPLCLAETASRFDGQLPGEKTLRSAPASHAAPLEALLDNLRSAWNVGAIFRSADGLGLSGLYLCGITPTPENRAVQKTALGAEENLRWSHSRNALSLALSLKAQGKRLIALEQTPASLPLQTHPAVNAPAVLIVGNELTGIDPGLLALCDETLEIPMRGAKHSLNVEVAFALAAHWLSRSPAG